MPDSSRVSAQTYEGVLQQLRDVISARVVLDENAFIQEIHVLARSGRSPKQVVRDVESALMVEFNLPIDHKKVSVAQMDWEGGIPLTSAAVKVREVRYSISGLRARCCVSLEIDGATYEAEAEGAASQRNRLWLAGMATLCAVEKYLKGEVAMGLEGLRVIKLGDRSVVAVLVAVVTPVREESLIGASFVPNGSLYGVANAIVKAVEPCLPPLASSLRQKE